MKIQFLFGSILFTALFTINCAHTYSLPLFGTIEPKDLCGYPNQCRAGGGNQAFTNFDTTSDKPFIYEGDVKNYLGKLVNVKNPFEQIQCINPEKLNYTRVNHVQLVSSFTDSDAKKFEEKLHKNLSIFLDSLLSKTGHSGEMSEDKIKIVLQKSKDHLKTRSRAIQYEQFALKIDSIDVIRAEKACQEAALINEKQGKKYEILSDVVILQTDENWKEEFTKQLITSLKIELGKDWDEILTKSGDNEIQLQKKLEQELLRESSQIFSIAYTSIL